MKKSIVFTIISALWLSVGAQTTELKGGMGIEFGCSKEAARQMMREKHPDAAFDEEQKNILFYKNGEFIGKDVLIWAFLYNKTNQLHTMKVIMSPVIDAKVFEHYDAVVADYTNKYGEPTGNIENWRYPYDAKDKYSHGTTAIKNGKCTMITYWQWTNKDHPETTNTILIEITNNLQTQITYQDGYRIKEITEERKLEKDSEM